MSLIRYIVLSLGLCVAAGRVVAQDTLSIAHPVEDENSWDVTSRFLSAQLDVLYDGDPAGPVWRVAADIDLLRHATPLTIGAGIRLGGEYNAGDGQDFSFADYHVNGLLRLTTLYSVVRLDLYTGYGLVIRSDVHTPYHLLKAGTDIRVALIPQILSAIASYSGPITGTGDVVSRNLQTWGVGLAVGWQP